jgi:hypothetical protein
MNGIKGLLASKKFIAALIAFIAQIALQLGWEVDEVVATTIISPLIGYVLGQSAVDVTKARAAASVIPLLLLVGLASSHGCAGVERAGRVAAGVIDCMTPTAKDAIGQFGPAVAELLRNATDSRGVVDWQPMRVVGRSLTTPAARCVLASVVAEALRPKAPRADAPQSSPLQWDPASLSAGFDSTRSDWGGATFALELGTL